MSSTVIVKLAVPMLPAPSVTEQVTKVSPSGKTLPDGGLQKAVVGCPEGYPDHLRRHYMRQDHSRLRPTIRDR